MPTTTEKTPPLVTVNSLSRFTGFSREAIQKRVDKFGLGKHFDPRKVLRLKPLPGEAEELHDRLEELRGLLRRIAVIIAAGGDGKAILAEIQTHLDE